MKFAFIIDPIDKLIPGHDTSVALMEAAQLLGHEVFITEANLLTVINSQAWANLTQVELTPVQAVDGHWVASDHWYQLGEKKFTTLRDNGRGIYAYRSSSEYTLSVWDFPVRLY